MFCKCGGKLKILDNVKNPSENEIYRRKQCLDCGEIIFTVEYEVIVNQRFKADWANNYKKHDEQNF